jgi:hypothetical protein
MRIKLLISVGGISHSHIPGDVVDWPEDAARAYIAEGYAEPAEPEPEAAPKGRKK